MFAQYWGNYYDVTGYDHISGNVTIRRITGDRTLILDRRDPALKLNVIVPRYVEALRRRGNIPVEAIVIPYEMPMPLPWDDPVVEVDFSE